MMRLASAKLLIEAPVNGGRNYKYRCSYVNKLGYMLETPMYPLVLAIFVMAVTIHGVRTISRKDQ